MFKGVTEIASPDFKIRHDLEDVAICFESISNEELRATFMPAVYGVLTAMALGITEIAEHADTRVQKVGDVCYLLDAGTGKPIYSFTTKGGTPTISNIVQLSSETIGDARRRALTIAADNTLTKARTC